jgi:hypothetical protein
MPRRAKGLTAAFVEKTTKKGRHADGGGLYLLVRSREAKFWEAHFTLRGKRRSMGGGSATGRNAIRLADAREWNRQMQAIVRASRDPIAERQAAKAASAADEAMEKAKAITFRAVADMFFAAHEGAWRSAVHRDQWRSSIDRYVLPTLGDMPVNGIDTAAVMIVLEPLWHEKTETGSRVRGRIERVLDFAAARGWREGEPGPLARSSGQASACASQGAADPTSPSFTVARSRRVHATVASGEQHRRPRTRICDPGGGSIR